jgi:hypothetical protein
MSYIGKVNYNGSHLVASTLYGTCETAASNPEKVVFCDSFDQLIQGVTIHVKFTNSNTSTDPTLKVNTTDAKPIYKFGDFRPGNTGNTSWYPGSVVSFTYDGTSWIMNDHLDDTNTWTANNATTNGYVTSPASAANVGWVTNSSGAPQWMDRWKYDVAQSGYLYNAIYDLGWAEDVYTTN